MGIVDNLKDAAELAKAVGNMELYRKIVELEGEVIDLTRVNREIEAELGEARLQLQLRSKMSFGAPFWWQENDETPFCPSCWELKGAAIHVVLIFSNSEATRWDCLVCKNTYMPKDGPGRRAPEPRPPTIRDRYRGGQRS